MGIGLMIERVNGGRYPSGEWWLWQATGRPAYIDGNRVYRLVKSWPVVASEAPEPAWKPPHAVAA